MLFLVQDFMSIIVHNSYVTWVSNTKAYKKVKFQFSVQIFLIKKMYQISWKSSIISGYKNWTMTFIIDLNKYHFINLNFFGSEVSS